MAQPNTDLRKQTLMKNANKKKNSSIELVASDQEISFINPSDLSLDTPPKYHVNTMLNGSLSPVSNDDNSFDYLASSPDVPASCSPESSPSSSPHGSSSSNDDNSFDYLASSPDVPASSSSPQTSPQGSPTSSPWKANNYSSSSNDSPRSHCKPNSALYSFNYVHESPKSPTGYPWLSPARMQGDADEFDLDLPKAKKLKTNN